MRVIIDRFEGEYAIVELPDQTMVNLPKVLVPEAQEGDVVDITVNKKRTEKRKGAVQKLMDEVWEG